VKHSAKALAQQAKAAERSASGAAAPRPAAQVPYWIVLAGVVVGLALMPGGGQQVRSGTLVVACALLAGSLARLVLPESKAGMLRSRRRLVDVAVLAVLGAGLLTAGLVVVVPGS
jgi:hypothetical protein